MENNINLEMLIEIVGHDSILKLLKEAGEKAGAAKDWERVNKLSEFTEALVQHAARDTLHKNNSPQ